MPRVVVKGGVLVPVEPLPPDWAEGAELDIALTPAATPAARNGHPPQPAAGEGEWMDDEDYHRLVEALADADRAEKERMRKEEAGPS